MNSERRKPVFTSPRKTVHATEDILDGDSERKNVSYIANFLVSISGFH